MNRFTQCLFLAALLSISASFAQSKKIPSIELSNLKGEKVNIGSLAQGGKIIVLDFWASWCVPCKKELTNIAEVYADWQKKYNVEIVAISEDNAQTSSKVKASVDGARWTYTVLLDPNGDMKHSLNFENIPYTLLLDKDGNIVYS